MHSRRFELISLAGLVVAVMALVLGLRPGPFASAAGPAGPDAPAASVAIPTTFNYQGTLRLADGSLANDAYNITIKLYDAAVGGTVLHSETFTNVAVRDGEFKVVLGDGVAIAPTVFADAPRFVGITVAPDPEMVPRQRLHPVPWAQQATTAVNATNAQTATTLVSGAQVTNLRVQGNLGIGTSNPGAGLEINKGATNDYALKVTSSGPGWGSGMLFENTAAARQYGMYVGQDGTWRFADNTAGADRLYFLPNSIVRAPGPIVSDAELFSYGRVYATSYVYSAGYMQAAGKIIAGQGFNGKCVEGAFNQGVVGNNLNVTCNQDVAETFATTEQTEPGDLVVMLPPSRAGTSPAPTQPTVRRAGHAYESGLVGVVSTNPGLVFDQGQTYLAGENTNLITADKTAVAMIGRVPVKVSLENGPIAVGDPLASSSVPGMAMKATRAGQILGYAMQSSDDMTDSKLLAWLQVGYYLPSQLVSALNDGSANVQAVAALQSENAQLKTQLASLETRLDAIERQGQAASLPGGWLALVGLVMGTVVVGSWKRGR